MIGDESPDLGAEEDAAMPARTIEPDQPAAAPDAEPLCLGPADVGRLITSDEFAAADYQPPWIYERVAGRLEIMSPEGKDHVRTSTPWLNALVPYGVAHPDRIQAVVPSPWVRVDADTERIGDIGVYLGGLLDALNLPDQISDLIIEFVSPSRADRRRDYVLKRADYLKVGVREYVIVDRFDRKVTVLTLEGDRYAERVIPADGVYQSPLLAGFALPLAGIWPR